MKKTMMSLVAAGMMLQGVASANGLMCGNFWVAGEALLLRPTGAYPYSVIRGPAEIDGVEVTVPVGDQLAVCPSYEWGYKVELGYRNCDKEILVNWLSFNNGYKNRYTFTEEQKAWFIDSDTALVPFLEGPGQIDSRNCVKYDVLDAEVAKWMCRECSGLSGRAFLGLRYARICHNRGTFLSDDPEVPPVAVISRSDLQGTGPRAGLGARWNLWCNFGLTGSAAGHLLIGSAKSQFFNSDDIDQSGVEERANVKNRKVCRIIPASEIKFGIDWQPCLFCGFSGLFEVGYQITHYFYGDQSTLLTQSGSGAATNHVHTDPMSFDGWYFRIGLMY
jgi:Legionella pneumophila major outer membrane protein precursor